MAESPFKISIPDALLDRLHQKLALTTLPDELEGAGWEYGVPLADVKRLVARWSNGYDWRHHEAQLNRLPQFTRYSSFRVEIIRPHQRLPTQPFRVNTACYHTKRYILILSPGTAPVALRLSIVTQHWHTAYATALFSPNKPTPKTIICFPHLGGTQ
ncbi:epoxide hydrolase N terminus-domain-containing protein [Mycena olivaceomarginata]|nr:epoxide hydrolase N terminus-domain-containing protein [Mycena olivaceomarginata]